MLALARGCGQLSELKPRTLQQDPETTNAIEELRDRRVTGLALGVQAVRQGECARVQRGDLALLIR